MNDVKKMKEELYAELVQYINRFEAGVKETAELFHSGEIEKARANVVDVIDGLTWIIQAVGSLGDVLNINVLEIKEHLLKIVGSLENNDDVTTAELFEYEVLPMVLTWKKVLQEQ